MFLNDGVKWSSDFVGANTWKRTSSYSCKTVYKQENVDTPLILARVFNDIVVFKNQWLK